MGSEIIDDMINKKNTEEKETEETIKVNENEKAKKMVTKHFSEKELSCRCCGKLKIDPVLLVALEKLRELVGKEITVNCAYRCPKHNKEVGGVSNSQHVFGKAADIKVKGMTPKDLAKLAEKVPEFANGGVGTYSTFVHVDVRNKKSRWSF